MLDLEPIKTQLAALQAPGWPNDYREALRRVQRDAVKNLTTLVTEIERLTALGAETNARLREVEKEAQDKWFAQETEIEQLRRVIEQELKSKPEPKKGMEGPPD